MPDSGSDSLIGGVGTEGRLLLDVVGSLLPTAAGIALSPFPIVAVILVVTSPRGRTTGPTFALGWLVGLSALTAVAVGVGELVGGGTPATWAAWARVVLGVALVALAVRKFAGRPRADDPAPMPGWMTGLVAASPGRALVLGFALAALNPKNVAFALASASVIGQVGQSAGAVLVEAAVFVLLASTTVLGALVVSLLGGQRATHALAEVKARLLAHNDVIIAVVLLIIGAKVLGDGLAGLA